MAPSPPPPHLARLPDFTAPVMQGQPRTPTLRGCLLCACGRQPTNAVATRRRCKQRWRMNDTTTRQPPQSGPRHWHRKNCPMTTIAWCRPRWRQQRPIWLDFGHASRRLLRHWRRRRRPLKAVAMRRLCPLLCRHLPLPRTTITSWQPHPL